MTCSPRPDGAHSSLPAAIWSALAVGCWSTLLTHVANHPGRSSVKHMKQAALQSQLSFTKLWRALASAWGFSEADPVIVSQLVVVEKYVLFTNGYTKKASSGPCFFVCVTSLDYYTNLITLRFSFFLLQSFHISFHFSSVDIQFHVSFPSHLFYFFEKLDCFICKNLCPGSSSRPPPSYSPPVRHRATWVRCTGCCGSGTDRPHSVPRSPSVNKEEHKALFRKGHLHEASAHEATLH